MSRSSGEKPSATPSATMMEQQVRDRFVKTMERFNEDNARQWRWFLRELRRNPDLKIRVVTPLDEEPSRV